ncbi:MAG: hypothetical protein WAS27_01910, partial [Candidatus Saccharimonadales bacterium]
MKDIDFDELDKAVNSLMGGVKDESDGPTAKTLSISTTLKEYEEPAYNKIQLAAERIGNEALVTDDESTRAIHTIPASAGAVDLQSAMSSVFGEGAGKGEVGMTTKNDLPKVLQRSSGRFMDVMHPSSDMTTANGTSSPISREGVTINVPARDIATDATDSSAGDSPTVADELPVSETVQLPNDDTAVILETDTDGSSVGQPPLLSPFLADAKV